MKKKQWLKSLNGVDDRYIEEAAPKGVARKRSGKKVRMLAILAACMVFVLLAGTLALFIPYRTTPPSVAAYANSPYYSIIQKLNEYNYEPPEYKNTAEAILGTIEDLFFLAKEQAGDMAPGAAGEAENTSGNYQEVTDNQVAGVIEADLIKRSDTHIYYLSDNTLRIYSIEGEDSKLLGAYNLEQYGLDDFYAKEFFLSADCRTVTVLCHYMHKEKKTYSPYVKIVTLDVSDPAEVQESSNVDVSGSYLSSRLTEHGLLVMTTMRCHRKTDFDDIPTYIPCVEQNDEIKFIAPDDIICPETLSNASYTVMLLMDDVGATVKDTAAYLSYSEDVYVSKDTIYATRRYTEYGQTNNGYTPYTTVSEISCVGYGSDGFDKRGSVTVDGYVLDQYSMDQYEGALRVFTTTECSSTQPNEWGLMPRYTSASLYVIDLTTMQIAASVEKFAPVGETLRSARFEGNTAYACTAVLQTDPVFMFDLSDLDNITVKDTGTIEGFSTSLVNFGDGFLLGIGQGSGGNTLKLEVYTEGEEIVESYCKYELYYTNYYPDYKCYYIDREKGLIGLGIHTWDKIIMEEYHAYKYDNYRFGYIVLHFDGESISEVLHIEYPGSAGNLPGMRGVYIDGYYYVLNGDRFDVSALPLE